MPLNDADAQLVAKYVAPAVWTYVRDGAGPAWVVDRVVGIDAKTGSLGPIATDLAAVKQTVASLQAGSAQVDVNALATALANNPAAINALGDAIASALSSRLGNG